ncbi:MAG: hypothetical protein IIB09_08700, partial [Bacteroidetes bacterium]|nr:hypothetical protein [Bacteroidota bacterium]
MAYDFERTIDDVAEVLRSAKEREGAVILLGSGCSKTAGIPLADDFCKIIKERYPLDYKRAKRHRKTSHQ